MSGSHVPPPDSAREPDDAAPSWLSVVDVLDDAVLVVSADDRIIHINSAASRLLGVVRQSAVGLPVDDCCPLVDRLIGARLPSLTGAARAAGGRVDPPVEVAVAQEHGRPALDVDAVAVPAEVDRARVVMLALRPVAPRRLLQEAWRTSEDRRKALARTVVDTVHDINNALAPVVLTLGGFREDGVVDMELLDSMARRLEETIGTVRRLRDAVDMKTRPSPEVDGSAVLHAVAAVVRATIAPEIDLLVRAEEGLPPVNADAVLLHAGLLRLAHRACGALTSGGRLRLSVSRAGSHACFTVEDTGASLLAEPILQRVLTGTDRRLVDPPLEALRGAAGALLAEGGFLRVTSVPARGTRVELHVDVSDTDARSGRIDEDPTFHGRGETVLFVDDEATVRGAAAATLRRLGLVPILAADGDEAMRMAATHGRRIDLVISDVNMPHTDGLAVARALRDVLPGVPVALTSGHFDGRVAAAAGALGVVQLLEKPFTEAKLAQCVLTSLRADRQFVAPGDVPTGFGE